MPITITPAPPLAPGTFFTICVDPPPALPATVTWLCEPADQAPQPLDFTKGNNCTKMMVPDPCVSLIAQSPGHPDKRIV